MKKDASRDTFQARRHYRQVLMQQGRVQVDADWNEQGDIIGHRIETEAFDIIGKCGAPMHDGGFKISPGSSSNFNISAGRYYVDGILCINETPVSYGTQPDLPSPPPISQSGLSIAYLDVWQRHLTALDDPSIREVALGGPDTATRAKIVWQVKVHFSGADAQGSCLADLGFKTLISPPTGTLIARTKPEKTSTNPCIVPPGAGYRGLDNQLYRVEVHGGGTALNVSTAAAPIAVTYIADSKNQVKVASGTWTQGQAVEIVSTKTGVNPLNGKLAQITKVDAGTLTLNVDVSAISAADLQLRPAAATWKWSRDNGCIVTTVEQIKDQEITVHDLGPDAVLGFKEGQWVELSDDALELNGRPGQLAQITKIDRAINLVTLDIAPAALGAHPKMRAWDGVGAIKFEATPVDDHDLELESGVLIRFHAGTYRTGDYWTIPARTATADAQSGNIEWPSDATGPVAQLPLGIVHHYCRLAMLQWNGSSFTDIRDCRHIFPPITELTTLVYVSGDGQEAMPEKPIPQFLQVGVFNGRWPVPNARVQFKTTDNGHLLKNTFTGLASAGQSEIAETDATGIASCAWQLEPTLSKPSQQVEARLLDADGNPTPSIVRFNGNLSIAGQVSYVPGCEYLKDVGTVQAAIDELCKRESDCECTVCVNPPPQGQFASDRIQAAIEEAKRRHGGKVCLKPGTYVLDQPIEIADATFLSLTGHGEATLLYAGQEPHVIRVDRCAEVTIESLNIVRSATAKGNAEGAGIVLRDSFLNIIVQDCIIETAFLSDGAAGNADRLRGIGIALEGIVADVRIFDCFIICGYGIRTLSPRNANQRACSLEIAAPLEIRENILCCGTGAIFIDALGLGVRIHDNWMSAGQFGIRLEGTTIPGMANIIEGNWIETAITGMGFNTDRTTVLNNRIHGQSVNPNESVNEGASAIAVYTETSEDVVNACQIAGNHCAQMQGMGILIVGRVDALTIAHNTIARTAGGGIVLRNESHGSRVTIESNQLQQVALAADPKADGLYGIYVCGHCEATIHANRIDQVGLRTAAQPSLPAAGIVALLPRMLRVDGNQITRVAGSATSAGIDILAPVGMVEITNNVVQVEGFQSGNTIAHCYALRVIAPVTTSYTAVVMTPLETTPRLSFGRYTEYAYVWDVNLPVVTLDVAKSLLLVRANELECSAPILPDHPMVLIDQRELRCTFGGNICVGKAGSQHRINMGVRVLAETIVADSNQVFGTAERPIEIADTWKVNWWTVLGNIVEGKILVNTAVLPEPWAALNRMI